MFLTKDWTVLVNNVTVPIYKVLSNLLPKLSHVKTSLL